MGVESVFVFKVLLYSVEETVRLHVNHTRQSVCFIELHVDKQYELLNTYAKQV